MLECLIEDENCTPDYPIQNHGSIVPIDTISKESGAQQFSILECLIEEDCNPILPIKKPRRNSSFWERNVKKQEVITGQNKAVGPPCNCKNLQCWKHLDEADRLSAFQNMYGLQTHEEQWLYCANFINEITKRTHTVGSKVNKNFSLEYSIPKIDGTTTRVCKTMFKSTLALSDNVIKNVRSKLRIGQIKDRRGETSGKDDLTVKRNELIEIHIKSLEKIESHYSREHDSRVYLRPGLNIIKVFQLYEKWFDGLTDINEKFKSTLRQYRTHFATFNIGFKMWKKDMCDLCYSYEQKTGRIIEEEMNEHLRQKEYARNRKTADKSICQNTELAICSAVFDLEKILVSPVCNNSLIYYRRSYHSFNFTVFDYSTGTASNYFWEEIDGGKGCREVIGCLLKFILYRIDEGIKEFRFFSDNCAAQNKNKHLFVFYSWAAHHFGVTIKHTWLVKGHTQNEADSVHSNVEKNRGDNDIFTPEDWFRIIKTAKKKEPLYKCYRMNYSDFKEVEKLVKAANFIGIPIKKLSELIIARESPTIVKFKTQYCEEEEWKIINLSTPSFDTGIKIKHLSNAYKEKKTLSKEKIADLRYLMKHHAIPSQHHE